MMTSNAGTKQVYTIADLAERWQVSTETVARRARDKDHPLPSFNVGTPGQSEKRARLTLRFRLVDIERWEADRIRILTAPDQAQEEEARQLAKRPAGYTGPIHVKLRQEKR